MFRQKTSSDLPSGWKDKDEKQREEYINNHYLLKAQEDIENALQIWTDGLQKFLPIKYMYSHGSAVREWKSVIDYTPLLSDIDIHIFVDESKSDVLAAKQDLDLSIEINQYMENKWHEKVESYLHKPRIQLIYLNDFKELDNYVPPHQDDIKILLGDPVFPEIPSNDKIKEIDFFQLEKDINYTKSVSSQLIDRTGFLLWIPLRRLAYRVSPAPKRLLSQIVDNPFEIWSYNKSDTIRLLNQYEFNELATTYKSYLLKGWDLLFNPQSSSIYLELILLATKIIELSYSGATNIKNNKNI